MPVIDNLEVFKAGTWNGDFYDIADLDDMVNNFSKAGFQPPVKLGHEEKSGDRSFGWVFALKRVGDRLLASVRDIPDSVMKIIKERGYDHVSAEVYSESRPQRSEVPPCPEGNCPARSGDAGRQWHDTNPRRRPHIPWGQKPPLHFPENGENHVVIERYC